MGINEMFITKWRNNEKEDFISQKAVEVPYETRTAVQVKDANPLILLSFQIKTDWN